jgi:predicted amidohydrolase
VTVRVAAVSPRSVRGEAEEANVARAVEYIAEAAAEGAEYVCFPEGYPGPYNGPVTYSALEPLGAAAREHGVHVIAGMVERATDYEAEVYRLSMKLIAPSGGVVGSHSRVLPNPKEMNQFLMGGKVIAPGDRLDVFPRDDGNVGMLVCSEAWSPELPLVLALKGADILFAPIGGAVYELHDHWQTILKARAFENTIYVVTCQNIWGMEASMAMIVGPDGVVAESSEPGVLVGDLDLDRLTWLRERTQDLTLPKPYRSIPGMLRHRRPDLYGEITAPRSDLYDFWYFEDPT